MFAFEELLNKRLSRRAFAMGASAALGLGVLGLSGCGLGGTAPSTKAEDYQKKLDEGSDEVYAFTDSCGRTVALPRTVHTIAPSGSYAQMLLAALAPEMMVSLSGSLSATQQKYFPSCLKDLPALGHFYGAKNGDLNYEEIIKLAPDIIIDVGEHKENIDSDLTNLQKQTGLPVIFVEATMMYIADAFTTLGEVLGKQSRGQELSDYVNSVISLADGNASEVQSRHIKTLYSTGEYGTEVKIKGSVHAAVVDLIGLDNVAEVTDTSATEVSMEQVYSWSPDVLILSPTDGFIYDIYSDSTWASVPAVQNRRVYEVPAEPYEWLDSPPSVQTVLGVLWLGNLLCPDLYSYDIDERVCEFFQLFWGYTMQTSEARELMAMSTYLYQ